MIKVESVWGAEGGTWGGWDSYGGTAGRGERFVSSGIRATGGRFGQTSWMAKAGRQWSFFSWRACFSPFDWLCPASTVRGGGRGSHGPCGLHRTAGQLYPTAWHTNSELHQHHVPWAAGLLCCWHTLWWPSWQLWVSWSLNPPPFQCSISA